MAAKKTKKKTLETLDAAAPLGGLFALAEAEDAAERAAQAAESAHEQSTKTPKAATALAPTESAARGAADLADSPFDEGYWEDAFSAQASAMPDWSEELLEEVFDGEASVALTSDTPKDDVPAMGSTVTAREALFEAQRIEQPAEALFTASDASHEQMPPASRWQSRLGRLIASMTVRKRGVTLSPFEMASLDLLASALEAATHEGSVCTTVAALAAANPALELEACTKHLAALEALGLLMRKTRYRALRAEHAGTGRSGSTLEVLAPFVLDREEGEPITQQTRLYLVRYFDEEVRLANALARLARAKTPLSAAQLQAAEALIAEANCDSGQANAVRRALESPLSIISGGPGTGKTRTVGVILSLLERMLPARDTPLRFYLAAPTGKAAGRLRESMDALLAKESPIAASLENLRNPDRVLIEERTLHKWLATPLPSNNRPSADDPLDCDVLVIDEASMMDIHLAARILTALGSETRVIILGDKHQLAAVGPGSVFADISAADGALSEHVAMLTRSHRFREGGLIDQIARLINLAEGEPERNAQQLLALLGAAEHGAEDAYGYRAYWHALPQTLEQMGSSDEAKRFRFTGLSSAELAWLDGMLACYWGALKPLLLAKDAASYEAAYTPFVREVGRIRALAAQRDGAHSVSAINDYMTVALKARLSEVGYGEAQSTESGGLDATGAADLMGSDEFPGRLLIVRQNHDRLGVFNGDVAVIIPARDASGAPNEQWVADFMDGVRTVRPVMLPRHETAFAMTIHQSQGSDFEEVGVFLPNPGVAGLASRELLYTAVTRTKCVVHLFGTERVLRASIRNALTRTGGLAERLREALP